MKWKTENRLLRISSKTCDLKLYDSKPGENSHGLSDFLGILVLLYKQWKPGAEFLHTALLKMSCQVQQSVSIPVTENYPNVLFFFFSHKTSSAFSWSAKGKHLNLLVLSRKKWEKMDWYPVHQYKWETALSSSWLGPKILIQNLAMLKTSGEYIATLLKWYRTSRD